MDRRIGRTRSAIRTAYLDILKDGTHGRVTVAGIARRANIDRKTFYLHYESPDDILDEIYDEVIADAVAQLKKRADDSRSRVSIDGLFELITAMIAKNIDIFEILAGMDHDRRLFEKLKKTLISQIENEYKLELGLTETQFRIYAEFFLSGIIAAYNMWITAKLPLRTEELAAMVTKASLYGLDGIIRLGENTKN